MKSGTGKNGKNIVNGRMKKRFLWQCVIPATLVLGIVCLISIFLSRTMACKNMFSALSAQQTSKLLVLENNISAVLEPNKLEAYSEQMRICLDSPAPDEAVQGQLNGLANQIGQISSVFQKVSAVSFEKGITGTSRGPGSPFSGSEYWYDSEKIAEGKMYYAETPDASSDDYSLFSIVVPVSDSNGICIGALVIGTNNAALFPMIQVTLNIKEQLWFLTDDNGRIYYKSSENIQGFDSLVKKAVSFDNSSPYINHMGTQYIMRTSPLPGIEKIKVVYAVPVNPIIKDSSTSMILSVIISIISIILIVFFVMTFSGKIVKEINDVRKSVRGISDNDFSEPIEVKTNDEMGMLVTEFNAAIDTLKYQAEHDRKTGFYNSETFAKKSVSYISQNHERSYAIVRVDIDNFSFINDIFDWEVGDSILIGVAQELRDVFGEDAVFGYIGNDIFVICTGYVFREAVIQKIERASERIKKSAEKYMPITPHFGICENAEADMDISILCDYAGIALKTVKGNLLQTYAFYDEKFDENHKVQKFVEKNKITALENKDFYILLQPKCDIFTGEVVGAEALVRWRDHSSGEIISPGKFIPIFEKNGFVITLDRFVWEETCRVVKKWHDAGHRDIPVSVNVSRMHIMHDSFVEDFAALVKKYDIPPHLIEVEITESALLENSEDALQEVMMGLKNKGFKLLMDDFASGYSSLIALQRLPFDVIKIDKGLIDKIGEGFNRDFVAGIIAFLMEIKKDIVIEGVEYDWQKEILKETGGRVIQGFCFSRPVSVEDFEKLAFGEAVQ